MSISILLLLVFQVFLLAAVVVLWIRLNKPQSDDQRLSKGLQLLQSKIAVLEDLSDRTEVQVNQLTALLESKIKDVQNKIFESEKVLQKIDMNIQKSLSVANIFQDKIPHQEIVERQNTIKYIKAAKLAHQGRSLDEIAQSVDLTRGELDLILKLNKENLVFSEHQLPEWASVKEEYDFSSAQADSNLAFDSGASRNSGGFSFESALDMPRVNQDNLKRISDDFKKAIQDFSAKKAIPSNVKVEEQNQTQNENHKITVAQPEMATQSLNQSGKKVSYKPYSFKRIDMDM